MRNNGGLGVEKLLREMTKVINNKTDRTISVEEMSIELTKPQSEFKEQFYLLGELGNAEFSKDGKLHFKEGFEKEVFKRSPWFPRLYHKSKEFFIKLARIFFGVGLLLSIALTGVTILIIVILILSVASKGNINGRSNSSSNFFSGGGGGGGGGGYLHARLFFRDLFLYTLWYDALHHRHHPIIGRSSYNYPMNNPYQQPNPNPPPNPPQGGDQPNNDGEDRGDNYWSSLLTDIFRFLFGDSFNSKSDHKLRSLRSIGYLIKSKQLGPIISASDVKGYVDDYIFNYHENEKSNAIQNQYHVQEGYMLPVLRCFNGVTEASSDGEHLYYYFPDFSNEEVDIQEIINSNAISSSTQHLNNKRSIQETEIRYLTTDYELEEGREDPPILEGYYSFFYSKATVGLGVWNFIQVVILGWFFFAYNIDFLLVEAEAGVLLVFIVNLSKYVYWYLLIYSIFYLIFPLIRYLIIKIRNKSIDKRNMQRIRVNKDLSG